MTTRLRERWFDPDRADLFRDRRSRTNWGRLEVTAREEILTNGDRLATLSPQLARAWFRSAPTVRASLGESLSRQWFDLGYELLADNRTDRDAALALFDLPPAVLAEAGAERLTTWVALGTRLSAESRKLGTAFFQSTGAFLARLGREDLEVWVEEALTLHRSAGWRGEFLAHAFLTSAPKVLPRLEREEIAAWARLGGRLHAACREIDFFGEVPTDLLLLRRVDRLPLWSALTAAATAEPKAAVELWRRLPTVARRFPLPLREIFLSLAAAAAPVRPAELAAVLPVAWALVQALPAGKRRPLLRLALQAGQAFPPGAVPLLRSLPVACETAVDRLPAWVDRGLAIARTNDAAGEAFFALESVTSRRVLEDSPTAVTLRDEQGRLRRFVQMLSGAPAAVRSGDRLRIGANLEELPAEGDIELPQRIDVFPTEEDNARLYRFLAAALAGRREFGTYARLDLDGRWIHHARLHDEAAPPRLLDWFLVADAVRVGASLDRAYPGLAIEQRSVARLLLDRLNEDPRRLRLTVFDWLAVWLRSDTGIEALPERLRSVGALTAAAVAPLSFPGVPVEAALAVAEGLATELARALADSGEPEGGQGEELATDGLIAAYLYEGDEDDLPASGSSAPPDTASPEPEEAESGIGPIELGEPEEEASGTGRPMSAEALQELLASGASIRPRPGHEAGIEGLGLYITDLVGKVPNEQWQELRSLLEEPGHPGRLPRRWLDRPAEGASFHYDEWDYHIDDYRHRWCRLQEIPLTGDSGEFYQAALESHAALLPEVRRQFQRIRPDTYRVVRGLEDGEDFDLNAVVDARVDRRARRSPSSRLYVARHREERDVATLFLIDMSASTDEPMEKLRSGSLAAEGAGRSGRRIIDVMKEGLVIMAQALEEIGDAYAIYGFSGHGRRNVEFYPVKSFRESLGAGVRGRIGGIEPRRSTRMGTALRHAREKMAGLTARSRHLILVSDGFPQDFDYGQDRRSNRYGLRDTSAALRECESAGITPFCITVDRAGHDYLREMCPAANYLVIDDIASLPRELPKIYQRVVRA